MGKTLRPWANDLDMGSMVCCMGGFRDRRRTVVRDIIDIGASALKLNQLEVDL